MTPAVLPLALSLSSSFEKIGAIAAFAALVGIALMSLLAFAQARELKRLREWAGRAPERAAEQEQRVGAQAAAARLQQPIPGAVAPVRQVPRTTPLNVRPVAAPGQPGADRHGSIRDSPTGDGPTWDSPARDGPARDGSDGYAVPGADRRCRWGCRHHRRHSRRGGCPGAARDGRSPAGRESPPTRRCGSHARHARRSAAGDTWRDTERSSAERRYKRRSDSCRRSHDECPDRGRRSQRGGLIHRGPRTRLTRAGHRRGRRKGRPSRPRAAAPSRTGGSPTPCRRGRHDPGGERRREDGIAGLRS